MKTSTKVLIGGGVAVAIYLVFFRSSAATVAPTVVSPAPHVPIPIR